MDAFREQRFDAVIADYTPPEVDSVGLLKTLRVQGNPIPFLLVTDAGREDVTSLALREGADFYMYKSRDPKAHFGELSRVIRLLVEKTDAERHLRERDLMYRTLFENTGTALAVFGKNGTIAHVNAEFESMTGYTRGEVEGEKNGFEIICPEDRKRVMDAHATKAYEGVAGPHTCEMRIVDKWGNIRQVSASLRMVPGADLLVASFVDISRYLTANPPGRTAGPHFRVLAEDCGDILYRMRLKPNFMFEYVSPSCTAMTGYTPEELYQDSSLGFRMVHPEDRESIEAIRSDPTKLAGPFQLRWVRKDGTVLWTEQIISPAEDENGAVVAFEGIARDVTKRVLTEQALHQANKRLVLMGSITRHDLMNQLAVMSAGLDLASDSSTEGVVRDQISMAKESVEKMRALLELSSEYRDMGMSRADWVDVKQACLKGLGSQAINGVKVEMGLEGLSILADPMFARAFSSLIDNSIRHNSQVTRLGFSYTRANGSVVLVVEDDGAGIPTAEKERVFQRGYGKNTGYGLYFVREVLGITGMTIKETGTPGRGARFEITVPENAFRLS
jgi:PAS domain S-box-containing protein